MWLSLVLIDLISTEGTIDSFEIRSNYSDGRIVASKLRDIDLDYKSSKDRDIGSLRIYSAEHCAIQKRSAKLRDFEKNINNSITFKMHHLFVPLKSGHQGIYNLVLPPGWKLRKLKIVRDSMNCDWSDEELKRSYDWRLSKRNLHFNLVCDTKLNTQIVEMNIQPIREEISFAIFAKMFLVSKVREKIKYLKTLECENAVRNMFDIDFLDIEGKKLLVNELTNKSDWFELKPNIFGIGINFNEILHDIIQFFNRKKQRISGKG